MFRFSVLGFFFLTIVACQSSPNLSYVEVSTSQLLSDYDDGEVSAMDKWHGRRLLIQGKLEETSIHGGQTILWMNDKRICAEISPFSSASVGFVNNGQEIVLSCVVGYYTPHKLNLRDCFIDPKLQPKE